MTATEQPQAGRPEASSSKRRFSLPPWWEKALFPLFIGFAILLPFFYDSGAPFIEDCVLALAYVVMALGLNIIVGFAGLLDLGYVAFFAIGAYVMGWFGSLFFASINGEKGIHILVSGRAAELPGIHANFFLILIAAIIATTIAGMLIGLPTLRLRGDYIAIVTLASARSSVASPSTATSCRSAARRSPPGRQGITPVDKIDLPFIEPFTSLELSPGTTSPWRWSRSRCSSTSACATRGSGARGSRCARTRSPRSRWACPRSEPSCWPTARGPRSAACRARSWGSFNNTVNADQFQFYFSILILGMVILGGPGLDLGRGGRRDHADLHQLLADPRTSSTRCPASRLTSTRRRSPLLIYGFLL
jgi:branched-chain amino acid transport system permease protein